MFQRFKKMIVVKINWWMNWLIRKIMKIVNWFVDKIFIFHHDELIDFQNKKINDWLSLSLIHDHFRKFTMRQMKMKFNHRFQRRNFFINANSRSFSLIHVVSWKFVLLFHSRKFVLWFRDFFRENFRFVDLKMFYVNFSFNSRKFVLLFRDFFLKKLHILTILFHLLAYLDEQFTRNRKFNECQLVSQNSKRKIAML